MDRKRKPIHEINKKEFFKCLMHLEFLDYAFKVLARKVRSPQTSAKANSNMLETRIKYQTLSWRINLLHKSNRNLYTSHCVSVFHL